MIKRFPEAFSVLVTLLCSAHAAAQVTSINVSYSPANPRVGEPYTATATVTATGPATPTGNVQILFSGNPETCTTGSLTGTGVTATASCTLISSTAGLKSMQAFYLPGNYPTTTPGLAPVTIQTAATSLALKVLPDPSARNRVFVQALVQPDVGNPGGSFSFTSGSNTCSPAVGENWCSLLPDQSTTTPVVSVSYTGDANFGPASAGTPITVTDFPWIRRLVSAPMPNQATDPYSNANVVDGGDGGGWSDDGRYYVFSTTESLVAVDSNGEADVYLWDERNRTTTLLSYGPNTFTPANGGSQAPRISGDGRFVVFETFANNLVTGDTNLFVDIIRQELRTGVRVRVTPDSANGSARGPDLSSDGRFVSFVSTASNLVAGDTNSLPDAFRADLQTSTTIRVSVSGAGNQGSNPQSSPRGVTEAAINGNGQIVAFLTDFIDGDFSAGNSTLSQTRPFIRNIGSSLTTYLGGGPATSACFDLGLSKGNTPTAIWNTSQSLLTADNNGLFDIYARTPPSGPLQLVSASALGVVGNENSFEGRISGDGSTVVFASPSINLAAGIDYDASDIFAKTLGTGAIRRVNVRDGTAASQSTQQFQFSSNPSTSFDASRIGFFSSAIDLTPSGGTLGNRMLHLRKPADQQTRLIARRPIGGQANADSFHAALSANAANVAIATSASNLVAGVTDANGLSDIYLRPAAGPGTTAFLISRTPGGQAGNGFSDRPAIASTPTPRVAFQSDASDLVAGDTNLATDIFIASPTGLVRRVSVSSSGVEGNSASFEPDISSDGERVVYASNASNLVAGVSGKQVYLHEVTGAVTTLVSRATGAAGAVADSGNDRPSISADGRVAVFVSNATNLVSGVSLGAFPNIYLRELQAPFTTRIVNVNTAGTSTGNGGSFEVAVDGTGSRVAFVTSASNLIAGDTNGWDDVYVRDMATGTLTLASISPSGVQFTAPAVSVSLSADGRYVGFVVDFALGAERGPSHGSNREAYVRDLQTGITVRVDLAADLSLPNGSSNTLNLAGNGAYLALISQASNLVPGDLNAQSDTLLLRNPLAPLPTTLQVTSNGPTVTGQPIQATVRLRGDFSLEPRPRGNVTVTGNAGETCTITDIAALNANVSEGSCTLTGTLNPGPRTLTANYTPTGTLPDRYAPATGTVAHTVNQGSVNLSSGFGSGTPVVGQTVTFSASVPAAAPAVGTPTGTVTVSVGGGLSGTCTITLPASNCTIGFANAGSGSVTFSYSGDANFLPAVNNSPITVARANTTITGSFGPGSPLVGAPVSFTANLAVVFPGAGTPTGQIFVTAGGGLSGNCTITLPATDCTITFAAAGTGTVSFGYPGNANFNPSSSTPIPITVTPLSVPTLTSIVTVSPSPVLVGSAYTVTVGITSASGTPASGSVTISAAGFPDTCTIILPANSCSIPQAQTALPGVRNLVANYSGTTGFDPSVSAAFPQTVRLTSTFMPAPTLSPTPVVVGQAFTATGTLQNTASGSALTPTGALSARVLPLGNQVSCTLAPQAPGVATYSCPGLISPIAAAKVVELRYAGSADQVFPANSVTTNQTVGRAPTQTRILSATPDPSNPGQPVSVSVTVQRAPPTSVLPDNPTGVIDIGDGVDSCRITLPATSCTLGLSTSGLRTLTARYGGDANHEASSGTEPHTVTGGTADLSIAKRNNRALLPGGSDVSWVIEVRNAGPAGTSALIRDPVPPGLSNFRWTCAASSGSQCSSAIGSGPLLENVTVANGGVLSYLLTARVDSGPEQLVEQRATVEAPTGVTDPNLANNEAVDRDPIGVFGGSFEAGEGQPVEQPTGAETPPR